MAAWCLLSQQQIYLQQDVGFWPLAVAEIPMMFQASLVSITRL
jgi:hypothetical protein